MAQNIGLNNNPAGSAVALGLGKVFKDWLLKHTSGKANNLVSKVSTKSIGKALIYANVANAANQTVADFLPHVNAAITWAGALPANVLNQTIGRIPVLGKIFRTLHNWITEAVSTIADFIGLDAIAATGRTFKLSDPNSGFETQIDWKSGKTGLDLPEDQEVTNNKGDDTMSSKNRKLINAPSFYENLDLHKTFSIPGAYTKKTVVNGTLATPKIVVHRLFENPMPDKSATIDRVNQKYSLIKAVRGLSATLYNIVDLYNYERFVKLVMLEYFVIKKVVQAAKTYSLVQSSISDNIIKSLGFDPTEVRNNLANYETLLCQVHRFITNNLPATGTWIKRLEYLVGANIPDYSDAKVATIHMFAVSMAKVFYESGSEDPDKAHVFDCIPNANNNNYSTLLTNFETYQTDLVNNDRWQQLIADYFGAFGSAAMWSDAAYPEYKEPLNLKNADNDLCREQIKNAFYLNTKITVITVDAGVRNAKYIVDVDDPTAVQFSDYQFGGTFDSTAFNSLVQLNYKNILDHDAYLAMSTSNVLTGLGSNNFALVPDMNGIGAQVVTCDGGTEYVSMQNHETIYTLHKDSYSEGEALEISQFKARSCGMLLTVDAGADKFYIDSFFRSQEYAMLDSTVYVFGSNGSQIVDQTYVVCNEAISDDDLQNTESAIDYPDEIMCWALIDWMPFTHFTFFGYDSVTATYSPHDILLSDMDAFGSLDDRAFITSINYSIYSLQAASVSVGSKNKRVDNLASVYKNKPSRQG